MKRIFIGILGLAAAILLLKVTDKRINAGQSLRGEEIPPGQIVVDYPADGSLFPPEFPPPTFLWRDPNKNVTVWRIRISFANGSNPIHAVSRGQRLRLGRIDPECISATNELPKLTPLQAAAHTWTPAAALWEILKKRSISRPARVTFAGFASAKSSRAISHGEVTIRTSADPAGAPIFYRDVPLMPTETQTGQIKPLASEAVRLIRWRLLNIGDSRSRVVMQDLPLCANCHSFSAEGKTLGMDLDGLQRNRGIYTLTPVRPETSIGNENLIQWSSLQGRLKGGLRVGFMSQVSPDGQFVVTTVNPSAVVENQPQSSSPNSSEPPSNYYVANFKDYRFLQVFYPTRGLLVWYSRATGILQPLPGADDPRFVQTNAVWSPDEKFLVFARAAAREPNPVGVPTALFANDPNERKIQYDLYRVPFNGGKGGAPEPIAGASQNGMSNSFPKVTPDGRWMVFVQCRNGLLMRPDSQLYIVPATGGQARRMHCNTSLMNSWHSFSPNGRWMVFSSKSRSPYTQMYLTHLDPEGNDSPAILIENATDANRAVNLPEFVNIAQDGLQKIGGPALEYYRLYDQAMYFQKKGRYGESALEWKQALEIRPDDWMAHNNLALVLRQTGSLQEALQHFQRAREIKLLKALEQDSAHAPSYNSLGALYLEMDRVNEAMTNFQKSIELNPEQPAAYCNLGRALLMKERLNEALQHFQRALELDARYAPAHFFEGIVLDKQGASEEAIRHWRKALELNPDYAEPHHSLGNVLYAQGKRAEALSHWRESIRLQPNSVPILRQTAWALATSPEPSLRDGNEAITLAVRAVQLTGRKDASCLDTLAAAYAEAGRFADAALTARRALDTLRFGSSKESPVIEPSLIPALPTSQDKTSPGLGVEESRLAGEIQSRIELYAAKKPFRAPLIPSLHP